MRKIERKIVKKYPTPHRKLIEDRSVGQNMDIAADRDHSIFPEIGCATTQRLMVLFGEHARQYAASQIRYRRFSDIKAWKSFSLVGKMYVCRERLIDEYLEEQKAAFMEQFHEKYKIPFSPTMTVNMLKAMGILS